MIAAGIDVGGTKIEAQLFGPEWRMADSRRVGTPADYDGLLEAVAAQTDWLLRRGTFAMPVGISMAGLTSSETGLSHAANVPVSGRPFQRDIKRRLGGSVMIINDCRAFALSEAVFGAARHAYSMIGLILGTGVGGGAVTNGSLISTVHGTGGEFGHIGIPAAWIEKTGVPILPCGCGRRGCYETYASGPGLSRLALALIERTMSPEQIVNRRHEPDVAGVWRAWVDLLGELLLGLTFAIDPQVIVLGGGLSRISNLADDLTAALNAAQLPGFVIPDIRIAEGGDASGARGAAYMAWRGSERA